MARHSSSYFTDISTEMFGPSINGRTTILVGDNGAGKSFLLGQLALTRSKERRQVFAIANTIYDRFPTYNRYLHRLLARTGNRLAESTLKRAIKLASADGPVRLKHIAKTLSFCGYDPRIGLTVSGFSDLSERQLDYAIADLNLSRTDHESIRALCMMFARTSSTNDTLWLNFEELDLAAVARSTYTQFLTFETRLKRANVVTSIDLFLSRDNQAIPLRGASSGELSLITSMVFLAAAIAHDAIILVDEPENSMHPEWQRKYVELLRDLFSFYEPTIVLATHAPLVVSGAEATEMGLQVFRVKQGSTEAVKSELSGVEEMLWSAFHTVTPENHFLSEHLVTLLNSLQEGQMTLDNVTKLIEQLRDKSYDSRQGRFLTAAIRLAGQVAGDSPS